MALTYSPETPLGTRCPDFELPAVLGGKTFSLKSFENFDALVVMFICNHCPYVQAIEDRLIDLGREYRAKNVSFVGICSNDPSEYPEDRPEALAKRAQEKGYPFPYLFDESQEV